MRASEWKEIITEQCKEAGTMRKAFIPVIDALSQILERRDCIYKQFIDEGAQVVVERISDRGAKNKAKNPLFIAWNDLNTQALTYWRELGCTPKGLKQISDESIKTGNQNKRSFEDLIREMENSAGDEE